MSNPRGNRSADPASTRARRANAALGQAANTAKRDERRAEYAWLRDTYGWDRKSIIQHMRISERTAQRWERQLEGQ